MSNKEYSESEILHTINKILDIFDKNFKYVGVQKITSQKMYELSIDLKKLFDIYSDMNPKDCGKVVITRYIKLLNLLIVIETESEKLVAYHDQLENAYKLAGRVSLEHFIIYYEWYEDDKLYENRENILKAYVYYLNKMCFDPTFEGIIANLPSGYGKSRILRLYEAFRLGITSSGTFLSLCSNDDLIKGQSRSVIDIIKNPRYGDVFPHLRYDKKDRGFFLKETDGEWKLRQCKMISSYYAKTTNSNVVGIRASLSIDIDDLYADYKEALDDNLNKYYLNNFLTVWRKRYVQNKKPQVVVSGTLWSATDFIARLIALWETESSFKKSDKFPYCKISEDGTKVIIQVPALDYVTGQSTCPLIKSTAELLKEKASMDTYLWETNFQQNPVSPEGLYFDWKNLQTYEHLPTFENEFSYASLDPARKGKDYVSMPITKKDDDGKYYLTDALFSQSSMNMLYDDIVDKIIDNKIIQLVLENNTDTSLKEVLESKLVDRGYYGCTIFEKYSTQKKEIRINEMKDTIIKRIVFPARILYGINHPIGKMMEQVTRYSFDYPNRHDDAPDSLAMLASELILGNAIPQKAVAVKRFF